MQDVGKALRKRKVRQRRRSQATGLDTETTSAGRISAGASSRPVAGKKVVAKRRRRARAPIGSQDGASETDRDREQLLRNVRSWPGPLYADNFPLVLLWTNKSGCTTVLKWFLFQTGLMDEASAYHRWPHRHRSLV